MSRGGVEHCDGRPVEAERQLETAKGMLEKKENAEKEPEKNAKHEETEDEAEKKP